MTQSNAKIINNVSLMRIHEENNQLRSVQVMIFVVSVSLTTPQK